MWIRLWGDYREPSQLFLGMTGKSGTRKTSALRKFMRPLEQWLMSMRFPGQEALPGPKYETICTDATPEALLARMAEQDGAASSTPTRVTSSIFSAAPPTATASPCPISAVS